MLPARIPAQSADPRGLPSRPGGLSAIADAPHRSPATEHRGGVRPEILEATPEADAGHWRVDGARFGRAAAFQPFAHGVFRARVQVVDAEWVMDLPPDSARTGGSAFGQGRRSGADDLLGLRVRSVPVPVEPEPADAEPIAAVPVAHAGAITRLALSLYQTVAEGAAAPRRSVDLFV
ncbi:MAG TPA: hypothetical protein VN279_03440 [Rhodocyclaceae bacterium]|nr:hypothetical protein [Rhodocyclaceae bacterium]